MFSRFGRVAFPWDAGDDRNDYTAISHMNFEWFCFGTLWYRENCSHSGDQNHWQFKIVVLAVLRYRIVFTCFHTDHAMIWQRIYVSLHVCKTLWPCVTLGFCPSHPITRFLCEQPVPDSIGSAGRWQPWVQSGRGKWEALGSMGCGFQFGFTT